MDNDGMDLEIIVNNKVSDNGEAVIQLETAVGAAIKHFRNARGINVPRSRFLPVKSCSDLLLITSDLYMLEHGRLVMNPERMFLSTPVVKLGDHFKKVRSVVFFAWMELIRARRSRNSRSASGQSPRSSSSTILPSPETCRLVAT